MDKSIPIDYYNEEEHPQPLLILKPFYPPTQLRSLGMIPWGLKECPPKYLRMVEDVVSHGEPMYFQHDRDITQVAANSLIIV